MVTALRSERVIRPDAIARAQAADGYISTAVQITGKQRWAYSVYEELYNMGHLMTAACVHHRATGKRDFLDVAAIRSRQEHGGHPGGTGLLAAVSWRMPFLMYASVLLLVPFVALLLLEPSRTSTPTPTRSWTTSSTTRSATRSSSRSSAKYW